MLYHFGQIFNANYVSYSEHHSHSPEALGCAVVFDHLRAGDWVAEISHTDAVCLGDYQRSYMHTS